MGPLTRAHWARCNSKEKNKLERAAHVFTEKTMFQRVVDIAIEAGLDAPFQGRLPHWFTVLEVAGSYAYSFEDVGDSVRVRVVNSGSHAHSSDTTGIGWAVKRSDEVAADLSVIERMKGVVDDPEEVVTNLLRSISAYADVLFSMMAEPRFVIKETPHRDMVKAACRRLDKTALPYTWVKLSWNMAEAVKTKRTQHDEEGAHRPYHLVRAHWREYDRETPKAELRDGKPGWWVWIESHHRGHPALGELKHSYQPKLPT